MSLNESIVEDAALAMPTAALTRPLPEGEEEDREAIRRLNPAIPEEAREEALRNALRVGKPALVQTNRAFHRKISSIMMN